MTKINRCPLSNRATVYYARTRNPVHKYYTMNRVFLSSTKYGKENIYEDLARTLRRVLRKPVFR